ncbi:unnamed protein product [Paramecium sonneborni]|uniref:Protein kinase domain-containing protein n=1 Tax=Paramecium sonneborni TaxID=65129 RepID=A0A8S1LS52_9CILI|nr:unnamed protein product [Paramecium sonneborni]
MQILQRLKIWKVKNLQNKKIKIIKMQQRTQSNQKIFNNQNLIVKKLSSGSLGVVFLGVTFQNIKCTIKVEKEENEEEHKLEREVQILK